MKFIATLLSLSAGLLSAAPQLRLATSTVGPVFIAVGQNGPAQPVAVTNIGDGTLALAASSSAPWLAASASGSSAVQITLATSSLAAGQYSGIVAVSAPGAVDAPQNITVTVQIGSSIPNAVDLYLPPGGSTSATFATGSRAFTTATSPAGGLVTLNAFGGSVLTNLFSYQFTASATAATPVANYTGSVVVAGSSFAPDNKTVAVTVHVTNSPIAASSPASLLFRLAQGAAPATQAVVFSNSGSGSGSLTLSLTAVPTPASWLSENIQGDVIFFTANPASPLAPGVYTTAVTGTSNAANGTFSIPVELDVLAPGPPVVYYQGVLDNALFAVGDYLAPGGIVALFGEQLTSGSTTQAQSLPLGTSLGGASVTVNGQPAPIYYVSSGQLDIVMPYGTASGNAVVQVQRDGQIGNSVSVKILPSVPRLLRLGIANYGIATLSDNVTFPIPATPGLPSRPAKAGVDTVVFYALGLGKPAHPRRTARHPEPGKYRRPISSSAKACCPAPASP